MYYATISFDFLLSGIETMHVFLNRSFFLDTCILLYKRESREIISVNCILLFVLQSTYCCYRYFLLDYVFAWYKPINLIYTQSHTHI